MKKYIASIFLTFSLTVLFGQTFNEKYGQPILVLIETNPWLRVIGSDVPSFALYENGQIIYKKLVDKEWKYFELTNDRETTLNIFNSFEISDDLINLPNHTRASDWTDQPTNILILNNGTFKQISVYGNLRDIKDETKTKTPESFLLVYNKIIGFDSESANQWLPEVIEVMATEYSHSPEEPVKWNEEWNDIKSQTTVKRRKGLYSIYLDRKDFNDFIALLKCLKRKQAVEINGKKFSLSYRLPFPNLK
jgi:hypothetical protein